MKTVVLVMMMMFALSAPVDTTQYVLLSHTIHHDMNTPTHMDITYIHTYIHTHTVHTVIYAHCTVHVLLLIMLFAFSYLMDCNLIRIKGEYNYIG